MAHVALISRNNDQLAEELLAEQDKTLQEIYFPETLVEEMLKARMAEKLLKAPQIASPQAKRAPRIRKAVWKQLLRTASRKTANKMGGEQIHRPIPHCWVER